MGPTGPTGPSGKTGAVPAQAQAPAAKKADGAAVADAKPQVDEKKWKLPGAKKTANTTAATEGVWKPGATKAPRRPPAEPPAELERVELKPAQPATGTPGAALLAALTPAQRTALGSEAHPKVGAGERQVLRDVRQRADGNFELDYTLVDKQSRALVNDVNRVVLVVGPDGKLLENLLPEQRMRELGIDRMPEDTPEQRAFKSETIAAKAADLKAARHVAPRATTERPVDAGGTAPASTVGVRAGRGGYSMAPPEIMEDIRSGGAKKLTLERGHRGEGVLETQRLLNRLGAGLAEDGMLGPISEAAIKQFQKQAGLPETGKVDAATFDALKKAKPEDFKKSFKFDLPSAASVSGATVPTGERLEAIRDAVAKAGLPASWATDPNALACINRIIEKESGWRVGVPNYTITQKGISQADAIRRIKAGEDHKTMHVSSTAVGLGQLLTYNMEKYMPSGRQGLGDRQEELIGALRYMQDRYKSPQAALAFHNSHNWW